MRKVAIGTVLALGLIMSLGPWSTAGATNSDFALFDGTNPANKPNSGAVCGSGSPTNLQNVFFTYHVNVSNFSDSVAVLRITFRDGDITRYQIPATLSLKFETFT